MVFAEVALGAIILTVNCILLGGEIVFFQSVCLLGYCLFPLVVAAIVCASTGNKVSMSLLALSCLAGLRLLRGVSSTEECRLHDVAFLSVARSGSAASCP